MKSSQLFLIASSFCEAEKDLMQYFENVKIDEEKDLVPTTSLIVIAATFLGSLLTLLVEVILKRLRRSKGRAEIYR